MQDKNNQDANCCGSAKRDLFHIHREFKLAACCNEKAQTFFITQPTFLAPNLTIFLTVMNSSTTCNVIIKVKSGCEETNLVIEPGSTGNFYVKGVTELLYSCESADKDCKDKDCKEQKCEEQKCRITVLMDAQVSRNY
ncbi:MULTISPECIES: hypothetical protein [Bacillus cereus group]|uniref:hypothetical protein n=1 Tax=Bacillus cereus group TaxID=86661 RepID=UPI00124E84B0|nr:hypothetical protein [Bacillus cereus]KAB2419669.1 hypothetical protein F8167_26935 [Bacillus cereus]